jgi:hypothetical protein
MVSRTFDLKFDVIRRSKKFSATLRAQSSDELDAAHGEGCSRMTFDAV